MGLLRKLGCCIFVLVVACQGSSEDRDRSVLGNELDPEMYRAEIQALENDLYRDPFDARAREAVALKLDDLAGKVAQEDGALPMLFSAEMRQLGGLAKLGTDANKVRGNWERIRMGTFGDAVWYRWRNSPQRPQVAAQITVPRDDNLRAEYKQILDELEHLVKRGKKDVERLGEPRELTTTYAKGDYKSLVSDWESWGDRWHRKLARIEDDLSDKPESIEDISVRSAHRHIASAIRELKTVPNGSRSWKTPFRNQWENRFLRAEKQIERARFEIER